MPHKDTSVPSRKYDHRTSFSDHHHPPTLSFNFFISLFLFDLLLRLGKNISCPLINVLTHHSTATPPQETHRPPKQRESFTLPVTLQTPRIPLCLKLRYIAHYRQPVICRHISLRRLRTRRNWSHIMRSIMLMYVRFEGVDAFFRMLGCWSW